MKYSKDQKLSQIIADNPLILMAMSRFGISLGFGEKTLEAICEEQGVDCNTFLAIANFISFGHAATDTIAPQSLIDYLEGAHTYFLDFCLPMIRRKLIDAIGSSGMGELALMILRFYDDYVEEVRQHMEYENRYVFSYVRGLLNHHRDPNYSINTFAAHHHSIHNKLQELKDILIRYLPQKDSNKVNAALFDIINCEQDLMTHCRMEDEIFVPVVRRLEGSFPTNSDTTSEESAPAVATKDESLSEREREIIECVARGMSNKEIADYLCISINTVTTHRRNIAQKLKIHSSAGLAIYAVINGILNIDDLTGK